MCNFIWVVKYSINFDSLSHSFCKLFLECLAFYFTLNDILFVCVLVALLHFNTQYILYYLLIYPWEFWLQNWNLQDRKEIRKTTTIMSQLLYIKIFYFAISFWDNFQIAKHTILINYIKYCLLLDKTECP